MLVEVINLWWCCGWKSICGDNEIVVVVLVVTSFIRLAVGIVVKIVLLSVSCMVMVVVKVVVVAKMAVVGLLLFMVDKSRINTTNYPHQHHNYQNNKYHIQVYREKNTLKHNCHPVNQGCRKVELFLNRSFNVLVLPKSLICLFVICA